MIDIPFAPERRRRTPRRRQRIRGSIPYQGTATAATARVIANIRVVDQMRGASRGPVRAAHAGQACSTWNTCVTVYRYVRRP